MRVSEILLFSVVIFLITVVFAGAVTVPAAKKTRPPHLLFALSLSSSLVEGHRL